MHIYSYERLRKLVSNEHIATQVMNMEAAYYPREMCLSKTINDEIISNPTIYSSYIVGEDNQMYGLVIIKPISTFDYELLRNNKCSELDILRSPFDQKLSNILYISSLICGNGAYLFDLFNSVVSKIRQTVKPKMFMAISCTKDGEKWLEECNFRRTGIVYDKRYEIFENENVDFIRETKYGKFAGGAIDE